MGEQLRKIHLRSPRRNGKIHYPHHIVEQFKDIKVMVLDKTGTIIKGEPKMTESVTASGVDDDHLLLMRISDFLDIKFGTVDTVVGTAARELLWSPCGGLLDASGQLTLTGRCSRAQKLNFKNWPRPDIRSLRPIDFFMPYLQLDVTCSYSVGDKKRLAAAMSETYARMMSVDIRRIRVAIRELGEGGVWRIPEMGDEPTPVSMLMLDIRRGRPAELRMQVAKALCQHCVDILGLQENRLNVEFTQHDGDEMYHPALGGYSPDWKPGEA